MKKALSAILVMFMLAMPVAAASLPDGGVTVIDPAKMSTDAQATNSADYKFEIVDDGDAKAIKMSLEGSDGWGWLVFDEYDTATDWSSFNTAVLKIKNPGADDILFGFNGMTASGPRIEFGQSGIIAYTADGQDISASIAGLTMDGTNVTDWGSGDPYFNVPAGFDGYMIFKFDGAFHDDGFDVTDINSMASFLNGDSAYNGYVLVDSITMYADTADKVAATMFPVIEEETAAPEVAADDQPATAEQTESVAAAQTSDVLPIMMTLTAAASAAYILMRKKSHN